MVRNTLWKHHCQCFYAGETIGVGVIQAFVSELINIIMKIERRWSFENSSVRLM